MIRTNRTEGLPWSEDLSILGEGLQVKGKRIPNRLAIQAMEGCDGTASGLPDELTRRRYLRYAEGEAGLIWFEATAVLPEARANPRQLYMHEGNLDGFRALVDEMKERAVRSTGREPIIIMQATHSGRYSKPNGFPEPLVAYHHPIFEERAPLGDDRILSDDALDRICEKLIEGAQLAARAGFDGVDIKSCHGYLLCELLSAYTRKGKYGGSYENRTKLYRQAVAGAIAACPQNFIVTSRLNAYDGFAYPYGFGIAPDRITPDLTEPKRLIRELYELGVPMLNITMGNPYQNPHVNRPYSKGGYLPPEQPALGVKRMLEGISELQHSLPELPLVCSALSYLGAEAPHVAAGYLKSGGFAVAGFGRQSFAYPDFAKDLLQKGYMEPAKCCITCSKCTEIMRGGGRTGCVIRDAEVYAPIYREICQ